jgi:hypothetical protein
VDSNWSTRARPFQHRNAILIACDISIHLIIIALLGSISILFNPLLARASEIERENQPASQPNAINNDRLEILPVGIIVGDKLIESSELVRGSDRNLNEISNWLIPLDLLIESLRFELTEFQNGQMELKSPGLVLRLEPDTLTNDSELGQVISVEKIENLLKIPVKFDQSEFALVFTPPWNSTDRLKREESPVVVDGLPVVASPNFALGGVEFETTLTSNNEQNLKTQGNLKFIGTALQGSWFLGVNQAKLNEPQSWELSELQYFRQSNKADYIFGLQPAFWHGGERYWGISTIHKWGFDSNDNLEISSLNFQSRLQPKHITRTITGKAAPGTFVRLVKNRGLSERIIAEQLVNNSGKYYFKNVTFENSFNNYQLLLYPHGQLTVEPEVRSLGKNNLSGNLSRNNRALVTSVGWRADDSNSKNNNFRGGLSYRQGISENLTVGMGVVSDRSILALGEIFYQFNRIPLQVSVSALTDFNNQFELTSLIDFQPSSNLRVNLITNSSDQHFLFNWNAWNNLVILAKGSVKNSNLETGLQYHFYNQDFSAFTQLTFDTDSNLRWNIALGLANWKFQQIGADSQVNSQLNYTFSDRSRQSLLLKHSIDETAYLTSLQWNYRSNSSEGGLPWQIDLGYGIGTRGSGIIASISTSVLPGVDLRCRYQEVSLNSDKSDFRLELVPHLTPQGADSQNFNGLYKQGGIVIKPFLDLNNNGIRDRDEALALEDPELLLILNNQPIRNFRYRISDDGILISLPTDIYRLDLNSAGFPLDWQALTRSYAVKVNIGAFTPVLIPLTPAYTIMGIATDSQGQAIPGVQVKAIPANGHKAIVSVTNTAGVFVLENLQQGTYTLTINNELAQPSTIIIDRATEPFQEVNVRNKIQS